MRVIGGTSRGRRLHAPERPGLRPTSDRVREAIFDILGSLGGVEGLDVVDLFAGSGALGIEALSRGAASATFVESDRKAVIAIEENLASTGFPLPGPRGRGMPPPPPPDPDAPTVRVVRGDAVAFAASGARFDVALCDPPYDFEAWEALLTVLEASIGVLESRDPVEVPERFEVHRVYKYGGTLVTLVRASAPKGTE
ncbi:MAG TPA: RsmD family RNA methyltransferase [Acidimicrobiales bacterium]|nr:RsmD family RNA methyltransferase [Acidimicrobiales bacterium]